MTIRKRRQPTPDFRLPPPYSPVTGEHAPLKGQGVFPYVAMMQVAKEDVHQNYVICRGHDIRYNKFYDYVEGDENKPGIPVAKPYGMRRPCFYRIGEIYPAILPMQSFNPQPATVPWRVGKNPGVATVSDGHPADLSEEVTELYTDEGVLINYMFLEGENRSMMVRALECILPGEGGSVLPQQWNNDTQCWEDSDYEPFDIIDPMGWLLAVEGDCFKVDGANGGCGSTYGTGDYMPAFPFGMTQLVRVLTKIDCGACGEVVIVRKQDDGLGHCTTTQTECVFQACNMSYRPISCDGQEYAIAHIIPGQCCLETEEASESEEEVERCLAFLMPYPRPMFAKGTLASKLCEGSATLTNSTLLDVCSASDFIAPEAASNTLGLHACAETDVLALWRVTSDESGQSCSWEVIAVADQALPDWVTELKCADSTDCSSPIEKGKKAVPYYGHFCECDDQSPDIFTPTQITGERVTLVKDVEIEDGGATGSVMSSIQCGDCMITWNKRELTRKTGTVKKKSYCLICPKEEDVNDGDPFNMIDAADGEVEGDPIAGTILDVITELQMVAEGGGGSGEDCSADPTLTLVLTGKTKTICTFCSADGGGNFQDGVDVPLPNFQVSSVTALTDAILECESCPSLTVQGQSFWAFCVGDEGSPTSSGECTCEPCEEV